MTRVVLFREEGTIDGEPYGPAQPLNEGEDFKDDPEWVGRSTAQEMADLLGLELRRID